MKETLFKIQKLVYILSLQKILFPSQIFNDLLHFEVCFITWVVDLLRVTAAFCPKNPKLRFKNWNGVRNLTFSFQNNPIL